MECREQDSGRLRIETDLAAYEVRLGEIQIEITGRCNMRCEHCRGAFDKTADMPIEEIVKILKFGRRFSINCSQIVVSGGEPLLSQGFHGRAWCGESQRCR